jgi:uncharacterized protein with GYD domain
MLSRTWRESPSDREGTVLELGQYDVVAIVEAQDDVSMTALGLSTGKLGNVRTQTLRAFFTAEMKNILGKVS